MVVIEQTPTTMSFRSGGAIYVGRGKVTFSSDTGTYYLEFQGGFTAYDEGWWDSRGWVTRLICQKRRAA